MYENLSILDMKLTEAGSTSKNIIHKNKQFSNNNTRHSLAHSHACIERHKYTLTLSVGMWVYLWWSWWWWWKRKKRKKREIQKSRLNRLAVCSYFILYTTRTYVSYRIVYYVLSMHTRICSTLWYFRLRLLFSSFFHSHSFALCTCIHHSMHTHTLGVELYFVRFVSFLLPFRVASTLFSIRASMSLHRVFCAYCCFCCFVRERARFVLVCLVCYCCCRCAVRLLYLLLLLLWV